jgi:ATPase subunit of ABC transporter with duplicated ATPase domains
VILVGPVGSGRTTLLEAVLGEVPIVSGTLQLTPGQRVAYASQKPFIRACSLRENVTFAVEHLVDTTTATDISDGNTLLLDGTSTTAATATANGHTGNSTSSHYADRGCYDAVKFAAALAACDLNSDVRRLPNGIETEIGKLLYCTHCNTVIT